MSDGIVSSCLECGVDVGWDIPCPNGCEPLHHYLQELPFEINFVEGDEDALLLLTLSDVLEIARRMAREESRDTGDLALRKEADGHRSPEPRSGPSVCLPPE